MRASDPVPCKVLGKSHRGSEDSLGELLRRLRADEPFIREAAATAIAEFKSLGRRAVPGLLERLGDPEPAVRGHATAALGRLASSPETVVPALIEALQDHAKYDDCMVSTNCVVCDERAVSTDAAMALGAFGKSAEAAAPTIFRLLEQGIDRGDLRTSSYAAAFPRTGPAAQVFVPKLVDIMQRDNMRPWHRLLIPHLLGDFGPGASAAVPKLRALMEQAPDEDDTDAQLQICAACALVRIDLAGNPKAWLRIEAELDRLQRDPAIAQVDLDINARSIFETLGILGPKAKSAVPKLRAILEGVVSELAESRKLASALGGIGPDARDAAPALTRQLWLDRLESDKVTAKALLSIGPVTIPALLEAARPNSLMKRLNALRSLRCWSQFEKPRNGRYR